MTKNNIELTNFDLKYIRSGIGRNPTEIELEFIKIALNDELQKRDYIQIINRLNEGAKRSEKNTIQFDKTSALKISSGVRVFDNFGKVVLNNDSTVVENIINRNNSILTNIFVKSSDKSFAESNLTADIKLRSKSHCLGGRIEISDGKNYVYTNSVSIESIDESEQKQSYSEARIYKITFGKRKFQKSIANLKRFVSAAGEKSWFSTIIEINRNGLAGALVNLMKSNKLGTSVVIKDLSHNNLTLKFGDDEYLSVLLIVGAEYDKELSTICKDLQLQSTLIGKVVEDQNIQIRNSKDLLISLPIDVFNLTKDVNFQHPVFPKPVEIKIDEKSKPKPKTALKTQLINLLSRCYEDCVQWESRTGKNKLIENYNEYGIISNRQNNIVLSEADNTHFINHTPRMGGRLAVANAIRRTVCTGAKPVAVTIQNILPKDSKTSMWKTSEILQGQEEAIRMLEVAIGSRRLIAHDDSWDQNITAIGRLERGKTPMDLSFKQDGDFISLLGSHRGELGGSAYQRYFGGNADVFPSVDLMMEQRLQDVVLQGISTGLIKSAINVSTGGLAIAVAMGLNASGDGIGARIHLSRKLKSEELLFGETQGLVVVSLAEEDIMEFERICMNVGVPSTTIGRVTDDGMYSFNELLKVKVERLRGCCN